MMSCMWVGRRLLIASSRRGLVTISPPRSSTYSSTALRAIPWAKGGTRRIRTSASGAQGIDATPSSSIQGMSSGLIPTVPVRSRLQGANRRRFSAWEPSSVPSIRWAPWRAARSRDGLISSAHCRITWKGLPTRIWVFRGTSGNSSAIADARLRLAWQSCSSPLSMMLLCSSSCSSNLNTREAWAERTSLMLWNTTWWYSTSNALQA